MLQFCKGNSFQLAVGNFQLDLAINYELSTNEQMMNELMNKNNKQ